MMLVPRKNLDVFENLFNEPFFDSHETRIMKTDVKEHPDKYELIVDLPGYSKENIKMHIEEGYLVINAKISEENENKSENGKYVHKERYYGECSRSFYIGEEITEEDIKANFKDGILYVDIPKKDETFKAPKMKYIEIN